MGMTFEEILAQILEVLAREMRISYRALKRRFTLDDAYLDDLKEEIIYAKQLTRDEDGRVLVWVGDTAPAALPAAGVATAPATTEAREPLSLYPQASR
jgi:hypothetical protein